MIRWLCREVRRRGVRKLHLALDEGLLPLLEGSGLAFRREREYVVLYEKL